MTTDISRKAVVCAACRKVGMLHCSDPVNCGNMRTQTDSWLSWLDDLPVPAEFDEGIGCLQEYITALRAALDAAEARPTVAEAARVLLAKWDADKASGLDYGPNDFCVLLRAIAGDQHPTEYDIKLAALKKDFPNGI